MQPDYKRYIGRQLPNRSSQDHQRAQQSNMPSTRSSLCLPGDPPKSPYPDFRRVREIVALLEPGQETMIKDIPATWAAQVIESVEAQGTRKEISLRFSPHIEKSSLHLLTTIGHHTIP